MAYIHSLSIQNFRGVERFEHTFGKSNLICLIGRGDSGKSTILEAIYAVLYPHWSLTFHDGDFYGGNCTEPICIEATLGCIPEALLTEDKYGLFIRGLDSAGALSDDLEDHHEAVLTVRLEIGFDLEPRWTVINERTQDPKPISAHDRALLNVFFVSDYVDRHFSWNKGNPLYSMLRQESVDDGNENEVVLNALREAKKAIDNHDFQQFSSVMAKVAETSANFGIELPNVSTSIDFRDILTKDGRFTLHDDRVPFRLKGKGSKRLISLSIQLSLCQDGGIVLVDELEQSLEPDRAQHAIRVLSKQQNSQIFVTTHSRDVIVELTCENLYLIRAGRMGPVIFDSLLQGCVRKHPEAFFSRKVIVCEGSTEVGLFRALNNYRIANGKASLASLGVCLVNGGGSSMFEYSKSFLNAGFSLCLICDSDKEEEERPKKESLVKFGAEIVDCPKGYCLEELVFESLSLKEARAALSLAADIKESSYQDRATACRAIWDAVQNKYGIDCPNNLTEESDSVVLRRAIGRAAHKSEWFKSHTDGERLGNLIVNQMNSVENSSLDTLISRASEWIDK
jgi:putative ATP-dependent endonuclease of OLD family